MTELEISTTHVPVETVRSGDEIRLRYGLHTVSEINVCDDGRLVVVYFKHSAETYENKARDHSGRVERTMLVEQSIVPKRPGELVEIARGNPGRAAELRARMEREQEERWAATEERWRRASQRDQAAKAAEA